MLLCLINLTFFFFLVTAIFKSLLYEACGRIVNPIYGSAGLLWSGSWQLCQAAVEAVLKGEQIVQVSSELAVGPPVKACDIRHVCKGESKRLTSVPSDQLHKVVKSRSRFKNSAAKKTKPTVTGSGNDESGLDTCNEIGENSSGGEGDCVSAETVEATLVKGDERGDGSDVDLDLDLTLGFGQWGRVNDTCKVHVGVVQPS